MKRAFTLIELLVVIAIIAILAAILFPVFAQAKESAKVTAVLSQYKQAGTSFAIYMGDSDDQFPMAMGKRPESPAGLWGVGLIHPFPADNVLAAPWQTPERIAMAQTSWGNSVYPYVKNTGIYQVNGLRDAVAAGDTYKNKDAKVNLTMNGLLHTLSSSAVNSPSIVPMLWPGQGDVNVVGRHSANPALNCGSSFDCQFNSNGRPSATQNPAITSGAGGGSTLR